MPELRRHGRVSLDVSVEVKVKGSAERLRGVSRDISLGGMQIMLQGPVAFGNEVEVHLTLPRQKVECVLPAVVRWVRGDVLGVQFGLLGARETHAITEVTKER